MNDPEAALDTARLVLEPLVAAHADALFVGLSDAALYRFIPDEPPASVEELRARYTRLATRSSPDRRQVWLNWALRRRAAVGAYVGTVQATVIGDRASIAYLLFPAAGGAGLATEAVARVVDHLFHDLGVAAVTADIDTRNHRSLALVERLGFHRTAFTPAADHFKGAPSDELHFELRRAP